MDIASTLLMFLAIHSKIGSVLTMEHSTNPDTTSEAVSNRTSVYKYYPDWVSLATHFVPACIFVDRYITLIYYITGFPGNVLSYFVWSRRRVCKGNSAAVYLAALSLNDIVVLALALQRDLSRAWNVQTWKPPGSCEVINTLAPAVQYASPMFVLAFTVERWLAICRPFAIDRICSTRRAINICIIIIVCTTILCCGNAFIFSTTGDSCSKRNFDPIIINVYLALLEVIFSGVVPISVLIFNCLVIREMSRVHQANRRLATISDHLSSSISTAKTKPDNQSNCCSRWSTVSAPTENPQSIAYPLIKRSSFTNQVCETECRNSASRTNGSNVMRRPDSRWSKTSRSSDSRHSPSFRSTTIMLLVVSFYMIVSTLLGGLMYLLHQTTPSPNEYLAKEEMETDPTWQHYFTIITVKSFGDEIALSYYAFGFFIYYATGPSFRQQIHFVLYKLLQRCGLRCALIGRLQNSDEFDLIPNTKRNPRKRPTLDGKPVTVHGTYVLPSRLAMENSTHRSSPEQNDLNSGKSSGTQQTSNVV